MDSDDGSTGHVHEDLPAVSGEILVRYGGTLTAPDRSIDCVHDVVPAELAIWQMALYADYERGRYPVWQTLDHPSFFPNSGILVVTVTVSPRQEVLRMHIVIHTCSGRVFQTHRVIARPLRTGRSDRCP